jgi:hypothetical protein
MFSDIRFLLVFIRLRAATLLWRPLCFPARRDKLPVSISGERRKSPWSSPATIRIPFPRKAGLRYERNVPSLGRHKIVGEIGRATEGRRSMGIVPIAPSWLHASEARSSCDTRRFPEGSSAWPCETMRQVVQEIPMHEKINYKRTLAK